MRVKYYSLYGYKQFYEDKRNCTVNHKTCFIIMTDKGEVAVSKIFRLFEKWGFENYIGEPVSQLQHAQQVDFTINLIVFK